jgi:hypothetical protein
MSRADPAMRERVRNGLRRIGIDVDGRVSIFHQRLAQRANIAQPALGDLVDDWLYNMTHGQAINVEIALHKGAL